MKKLKKKVKLSDDTVCATVIIACTVVFLVSILVGACTGMVSWDDFDFGSGDKTFAVKGATVVDAAINGKTHRFVCCRIDVSEFRQSEKQQSASLIGADEKFTASICPDGSIVYCSTYYDALDEDRGYKIRKEFIDCGTDIDVSASEANVPLTIQFNSSSAYSAGILDDDSVVSNTPEVTFRWDPKH